MDTNRIELDEAYMQMAEVWAKRSYATRSKVGALLVNEQQIISDGYNGMPSGMPNHEIEIPVANQFHTELVTNPLVIHAEANVFDKLSKNGTSTGAEGATLYVTMSPCLECSKRIINNKIKRVVYRVEYRDTRAIDVLRSVGIEVVHLPGDVPQPTAKKGFLKGILRRIKK